MNIPDEVLNLAAQGMWDIDSVGPDSVWNDLAPSFRASLMTQVEAACQPIAEWARKEALAEVLSTCEQNRVFLRTVRRDYIEEDFSDPLVKIAVIRALVEGEASA
ncbi:hypothetical protein [Leifsonia aquatica]|uniref:hypothetical protein n=1 Tax=Leifsonia aquatica TaxID=144185 RepID=UPI001966A9B2|nr:hypothetical protein [Leifsonia aquatica]